MKKFIEFGNGYAKKSDWSDFALLKLCVCAIGIIIGTLIPQDVSKIARIIAVFVFAVTYILLMIRVVRVLRNRKKTD